MFSNSQTDYEYFEASISKKRSEMLNAKERLAVKTAAIITLKCNENKLRDEIIELQMILKKEKENAEEYSVKISDKEWQQTKSELAAYNEKNIIEKYMHTMELHKSSLSSTNSSDILMGNTPVDYKDNFIENFQPELQQNLTQRKLELEALAAQCRFNILECQQMHNEVTERHTILMKRNAATLLRLRKNLQDSEDRRKEILEKISYYKEN